LNYAGVDTRDREKIKSYVDSENSQRPDLAVKNEKDMYNIEHGKLTYYLLIYSFRNRFCRYKKVYEISF